jgi:serine/threonine-protein kinase
LFELLTGVTAFDEPSLLELSAAILEREPVPLQTLRPDATEELEEVVLRCLTKNPDHRYQNVAELAAALYPFGPRRARISAERCYHMLKSAGMVKAELTLASAFPPPMASGRVTAASVGARPARTTTPAALDILVDDDAPPKFRRNGGKIAVLVALSALAAAAAFVVLRESGVGSGAASAAAAPVRGAELPTAQPIAPHPAGRVIDLDEEPSQPVGTASAAKPGPAAKLAASPNSGSKLAKAPRPAHTSAAAGGKRARGSDDELDPGF